MNYSEILTKLSSQSLRDYFKKLYGNKKTALDFQIQRYKKLVEKFAIDFPESGNIYLFSTPGRTEVGGNHTDHNAGRVLAAAVDLDIIAAASPSEDSLITIYSDGYPVIRVNVNDPEKRDDEKYTSSALVRGVCSRMKQLGYKTGGFHASVNGRVPGGSGLSSSAAFEVLIATILNHFYNDGKINNTVIAQIAQYAENEYFGKPCGLMDQTACAYGGLVFIDFKDFNNPVIEKLNFDFSREGYTILIIDTGGNHADLHDEYEALENEMKSVAKALGGKVLREFSDSLVLEKLTEIRGIVSDRAILRAFHFFNDDKRVVKQVEALKSKRFDDFLQLIKESGESSWMLCQNIYSSKDTKTQGISIALATTGQILKEGAWRVHGGGFAGTIQVFLKSADLGNYIGKMKEIFGPESCHEIFIRPVGTTMVDLI